MSNRCAMQSHTDIQNTNSDICRILMVLLTCHLRTPFTEKYYRKVFYFYEGFQKLTFKQLTQI